MNMPSTAPFSTTLKSPATIFTPADLHAFLMEIVIFSKSAWLNPSSAIIPQDKYLGIAPETARSFTVPHTESFPMSPPGKNKGLTTNESVV